MKKFDLVYLGTCLPDYFQGFGGEVLCVPLNKKPRASEVLKGLLNEIGSSELFIDGEYVDGGVYDQLRNSAVDMFCSDLRKKWSYGDDLSESYAYFGIVVGDSE